MGKKEKYLEGRAPMNITTFPLYGNLAYTSHVHLVTPFKEAILNNQEKIF
jgi:hypothetical protein